MTVSEVTIDTHSPERAWPPFMDWLIQQGIDPHHTRSITISPENLTASVTVMCRDADGKHYVVDDDVATEVHAIQLTSMPPRRHRSR